MLPNSQIQKEISKSHRALNLCLRDMLCHYSDCCQLRWLRLSDLVHTNCCLGGTLSLPGTHSSSDNCELQVVPNSPQISLHSHHQLTMLRRRNKRVIVRIKIYFAEWGLCDWQGQEPSKCKVKRFEKVKMEVWMKISVYHISFTRVVLRVGSYGPSENFLLRSVPQNLSSYFSQHRQPTCLDSIWIVHFSWRLHWSAAPWSFPVRKRRLNHCLLWFDYLTSIELL